jgi:hypothetical protein
MTSTLTSDDIENDRCPRCGVLLAKLDEAGGIARIRELEAERDRLRAEAAAHHVNASDATKRAEKAEAEKAARIERCAEIADKYWAREVASQIRALAKPI